MRMLSAIYRLSVIVCTLMVLTSTATAKNPAYTEEEMAWINRHPVITLAIDNTYPPLNYVNENGELTGLCVDFVNAFAKKAGVKVEFEGSTWSVAIKKALNHEVDGIVNADATAERKTRLNFTVPYVRLPSGLVTLKSAPNLESISDLSGKLVCAKINSSHSRLLSEKTSAEVVPIETLEEGLERVIKGEAFGVFDDVSVLGHLIAKYNFANLKINLIHHDDVVGVSRIGLRNDDPILLSVINKAILSLTQDEKEAIQSKWLTLVREKTIIERHFDWTLFLKITLPALALAIVLYSLVFLHNQRLRHAVEDRTRDLQKSQALFRALIDQAADAIFVHDLKGNLLIVNRQACQSLGYTSDELLDMSVTDIDVAEWDRTYLESLWREITPGKHVTIEGLHRRKTGELFPVEIRIGALEVSGQPAILALARDIAKRREEEHNRLMQSAVIEQAHDGVLIADKDGIIQYVNPAFERISGYPFKEVVGKDPRIFNRGQHSDAFYDKIWERISSGEVWTGNFASQRKDGRPIEEETTISPIKDDSGEIINYAAITRDVTQERILERQLRQSQKLEAIGTLAGGIAHDFNNILSAIIGYTELLKIDLPRDIPQSGYLEEVLKASHRAKDLVHQILTFSRQTEQEIKPVAVALIANEVLKLLRASLPSNIEIIQHLETDALVMADPTHIHQIIMNLCTNAGHAMREKGGTLDVRVNKVELDALFTSHYPKLEGGTYLKLTVSDTGQGMPKNVLERIFEPFYTTKDKSEGTGMGLAVVHGIIESYGGIIDAHSEPGKGTRFRVFLPVISRAAEVEVEEEEGLPTGTEKILFIDDEPALVKVGERLLESLGYGVVGETNPATALKVFAGNPNRFDLVITDKSMPELTGLELAEKLFTLRKDIPIIMCTGFHTHTEKVKSQANGIKGVLNKPVVRAEMARMVRKILDGTLDPSI
jgi:PAS domain S-box-containing protein